MALAAVSGLALWTVALAVPAAHLGLWGRLTSTDVALGILPLVALAIAIARRSGAILVAGVPSALLPALLVRPELTGPRIYGVGAFVAVLLATLALIAATVRRPQHADPLRADPLSRRMLASGRAIALALILLAAFFLPAAAIHLDPRLRLRLAGILGPHEGLAIALFGLIFFGLWLAAVWRWAVRGLGRTWSRPERARVELERFAAQALQLQRARWSLIWSLTGAMVASLALWTYLRHGQ